ncbi:enoyl-CoA hydratase [Sulfitobacter sp. SK012]|uniref:enoyl-CoA hydratase/isomerase family protein n=1 Tax=Sulfitobacter sp. SK012 TaxID=1389005 RepID=UPI000E0C8C54|nr:enoyl-CoA hydratase/isomerase family protein [Sulfitobacter sp. SK012]AXI47011.1 enoyl-CoA hydratase [Sulfitobacter sp. SK012]
MSDIDIRVVGTVGRITLTRAKALNAMTYEMCLAIEAAFDGWRADPAVSVIVIDAEGDRAFCAGGDIAELYATGRKGDFAFGQQFWADEYRLNYKIFTYPKPVVSFLNGFTMGGGVGIGCHGSHRIVGETSQIAMPECGIGLVPDVGGSLMLALAPGSIGEYLGMTAARMDAADAIYAGFADIYIPEELWPSLIDQLERTGDVTLLDHTPHQAPGGKLKAQSTLINTHFKNPKPTAIKESLSREETDFARATLKAMSRNAPLSLACTAEMLRRLRETPDMATALDLEYRFTYRAMAHGDLLEGIRAAIIDKDRNPQWQFADGGVPQDRIDAMLAPLGSNALKLEG